MSAFDQSFAHVVGIEGRYSNDPADSGGETMYGITVAIARANGYAGPMDEMPLAVAKTIYQRQYWELLRLDDIAALSVLVAAELFDTAVNCGVGVAGRCLQRALNAFNRQQADYPDATVDGVVGPMTVYLFRQFMAKRGKQGEVVMLRALNALQGARYIDLVEKREKDERFVFGWFANRVA